MRSIAFTIEAEKILRVLTTQIQVFFPNSAHFHSVNAIWDTGASGSAITKRVAEALDLRPTGRSQVHTANGMAEQYTYTVDLRLPSGVLIQGIIATEVDGLSGGCDALIGMDIITLGDFSITNHEGKTCMSFRVPSSHKVDYVENPNYGVTPIKNTTFGGSNFTTPKKKRKK